MFKQIVNEFTEWTNRAARGECQWVCADCSFTFPEGMPDECAHNDERCNRIIKRDKLIAGVPFSDQ